MSVLILSGFACPSSAWSKFGSVIALGDLLEEAQSADFNALAELAASKIKSQAPATLILHDFGVVIGFLALQKLFKDPNTHFERIVFFNGAIRGFDVSQNRHPFWIQFSSFKSLKKVVKRVGGEMDPRYSTLLGLVKKIYLRVILFSLYQKVFKPKNARKRLLKFNGKIELILSGNDPFISRSALQKLEEDLKPDSVQWQDYGHFPYSLGEERLRELLKI